MKLTAIFLVLALSVVNAQQSPEAATKRPVKRSYVCPPNFIRLGHRCYFFSREAATWQDSYFKCRDLHSNLAIIRNANQDKVIRRILSKRTLAPLERWLGGWYDWEQMSWKWAASGKPLTYRGFSQMEAEDKEKLRWHCIIVDPNLQFKWNTRSCVDQKHYICHTKIKIVTNKGKKKLSKQYNVNKHNRLNEIPVPVLPEDLNNIPNALKDHRPQGYDADFASRPKSRKKKSKKARRRRVKNNEVEVPQYGNNTVVYDVPQKEQADERGRKRGKDLSMKWKTYFKDATLSPLHPKAIVEEFSYAKET